MSRHRFLFEEAKRIVSRSPAEPADPGARHRVDDDPDAPRHGLACAERRQLVSDQTVSPFDVAASVFGPTQARTDLRPAPEA